MKPLSARTALSSPTVNDSPSSSLLTLLTPNPPDPIIFRGLKSLTLADTQQQSLLRLALEGISVYSPHTAVDAVGRFFEPKVETEVFDRYLVAWATG